MKKPHYGITIYGSAPDKFVSEKLLLEFRQHRYEGMVLPTRCNSTQESHTGELIGGVLWIVVAALWIRWSNDLFVELCSMLRPWVIVGASAWSILLLAYYLRDIRPVIGKETLQDPVVVREERPFFRDLDCILGDLAEKYAETPKYVYYQAVAISLSLYVVRALLSRVLRSRL